MEIYYNCSYGNKYESENYTNNYFDTGKNKVKIVITPEALLTN